MELRKLTDKQIRIIYQERIRRDFSPEEIKPLSRIRKAMAEGHYACYGAFEGEQITAYAFLVINHECAMIDYLAVREDLRGKGTGSRFLQLMMTGLMQPFHCVLLESEDPDFATEEAEANTMRNRLRFYLRNGLIETGVVSTVWYVHYRILVLPVGEIPSAESVKEIYSGIYRMLLPRMVYQKMVRL